jgi:ATP-dependent helicase/nuclease subunit A
VPAVRSPLLRAAGTSADRGTLIHALLQHLPDLPPEHRHEAARIFAARTRPAEADAIADQVIAILNDPALAPLFGPASRAEQAFTGLVAGSIVTGRVDRLVITDSEILVADYKTSRTPPASPAQVPVLYLRQLAAYRAVLRRLYPDRRVRCALVWTEAPQIMMIGDELLDRYAPDTRPMHPAA